MTRRCSGTAGTAPAPPRSRAKAGTAARGLATRLQLYQLLAV